MVLVEDPDPIAAAIYRLYEDGQDDWRRDHLGASVLGDDRCLRALWYSFRWAVRPSHPGRVLRLFQRGEREEEHVLSEFERLGCRVSRRQASVSFVGGHVGGSCDAVVSGLPEPFDAPHVVDVKTANKRRFDAIARNGIHAEAPQYVAQITVYMLGLGVPRGLILVVCKDDDRIRGEYVPFDDAYASGLLATARLVVEADQPPPRVSEDPSFFVCKLCDYRGACQLQQVDQLARNCRTCASATAEDAGGSWRCDYHGEPISSQDQRRGCEKHVLIPRLVPHAAVDADEDERWVRYRAEDGREFVDRGGRLTCDSSS